MDEISRFGKVVILKKKLNDFLSASKSKNTKRAYRSDWRQFTQWCEWMNLEAIPADADTVALYITDMADRKLAVSTISRSLTSISQAHQTLSLLNPTKDPKVSETFKGICRTLGKKQKQAKPLVLAELKRVIEKCGPSFLGRRDAALILIGWAGALRRSELVSLKADDLDFVAEGLIINVRKSKTDQEGEGYLIGIPHGKEDRYCPVNSLQKWIKLSGVKGSEPVFYAVGSGGKDNFYAFVDDMKALSDRSVNLIIKKRVEKAGIPSSNYSGHSLRAGFITSAAAKQTPESTIQIHTRHASTKVMRGYIREGNLFVSNPLSLML